jgi:RIP metalloprotease RseP
MSSAINMAFSGLFVFFFFGLCIFVHELGHFLAAKWRKLHIIAFSIGFKKIWAIKHNGIEYRIGCIPFGGYVELPQIDITGEAKDENGNILPPAKPLDKILTAAAGPFCNIVLGVVLGTFIWIHGIPFETPKMDKIEVVKLDAESPEYKAGLRDGDIIFKVNGKKFYGTWNDFVQKILFSVGKVSLDVQRADDELLISYLPAENDKRIPGEKIAYPFFQPKIPVAITPPKNSPAYRAGLRKNDIILSIDGIPIDDYNQFSKTIDSSGGRALSMTVLRGKKEFELKNIIPEKVEDETKIFRIGIERSNEIPIKIISVISNSPAEKAGLRANDAIEMINGKKINNLDFFLNEIQNSKGSGVNLKIARGTESLEILSIKAEPAVSYSIGVQFIFYSYPNPFTLFVETVDKTYNTLKGIFSKQNTIKAKNLSGPIGIVHSVGKIIYYGQMATAIYIIAFISYSLAIFNLLPLPVLDGGHIALSFIELIRGKPLPEKMIKPVFVVFVVLLVGLMIFVTYYDILRVIRAVQ